MLDKTVSRRTVAKGVAWSVPVVAIASAAPAQAASGGLTAILQTQGACVDPGSAFDDSAVIVTVTDGPNTVSGASVTFTISSDDGGTVIINGQTYPGSAVPLTATTDGNGVARLLNVTAGAGGSVSITASVTSGGVTVQSNPASLEVCSNASNLFVWGWNANGQAAGGSTDGVVTTPVAWQSSKTFKAVAGCWSSLAAITKGGEIYSSGNNGPGSFGDGTFNTNTVESGAPAGPAVTANAIGEGAPGSSGTFHASSFAGSFGALEQHFFAVGSDGNYYATGENAADQWSRGDGTVAGQKDVTAGYSGYTRIGSKILDANPGTHITKVVSSGYFRAAYLLSDGTVWNSGQNWGEAYGDATNTANNTQGLAAQTVTADGSPLTGIVDIAISEDASMYVDSDGTLWGAGWNTHGQLPGLGSLTDVATPLTKPAGKNVKKVVASASDADSFVVQTSDGAWYGVGSNLNGQLGIGTTAASANKWTKVQVPSGKTVKKLVFGNDGGVLLATDGTVWFAGANDTGGKGDGTTGGASGTWSKVPLSGKATDVAATWWDTYAAVVS